MESYACQGNEIEERAGDRNSNVFTDSRESGASKQRTLQQTISKISSFKEGGDKYGKVTEAILFMICRDNQPISIVEDEGFRQFLKVVAPLYNVPSRRTIGSLIDKKYEAIKAIFEKVLSSIQYVCLTTDIWTETHQMRSFLGVTCHFISLSESAENESLTTKMELNTVTLGVYELNESHTGENLAQKLLEVCSDWSLKTDCITAVVTDGGSNIVSAVEKAFGKKKHTYCFAHLLNLMAQKSVDTVPDVVKIINDVKTIVKWFKQSVIASDELRKKTEHLGKKKLIQSVSTRWNSTYYMVERFLFLREIVASIVNFNTSAPQMPSARDLDFMREFCTLLRPIEFATKEASGDQFVTSSIVIPIVKLMRNKIREAICVSNLGKKLKESVLSEYNKRFGNLEHNHFLATGTILDPRFKTIHFEDKIAMGNAIRRLAVEIKQDVAESSECESGTNSSPHSAEGKQILA